MSVFGKVIGSNEQTSHPLGKVNLQIKEKDIELGLPERFVIENPEGLEISKRITVGPYGLENDYGDKFIPASDSYIDPNDKSKYVIILDLLDAEAEVKIRPGTVTIEGKK